jgi:2-amino-4-hydroxy-6-hydroxymethyldihydropteridine diphosphokinase
LSAFGAGVGGRGSEAADRAVESGPPAPNPQPLVFVGLGSNLGDRRANLEATIGRLAREPGVRVVRRSGLYETEPVGVADQPWFLNAVLEIETRLAAGELLRMLKRIERELGRRPGRRWGERLIDLDLLVYGEQPLAEPDLTVPHPEMWRRLFVLVPLAELAPDLLAPDGRSIGRVIEDLAGSQAIRALPVPLSS